MHYVTVDYLECIVQSQGFTHAQITAQVNKISGSSILKNSPVLRQFLHFVVDETLEGNGERIKEYTIGTKVLGRKSDFDPQLDAIVRIHAGRLRRALNEFYSGEGKGDAMRISIPKGGYTPNFTTNGATVSSEGGVAAPDKTKKPVLAVMPFRNVSHNEASDAFCQELGEFASTELARLQELTVISYSSCESAAGRTNDISEMGSLLGAEYVLTGSIFIDYENLRVLLQLSRGDSGKQLWSNTVTRKVVATDLFGVQEEVINIIVASVGGYYGAIYRDVIESARAAADTETNSVIVWYDQFQKQLDRNTFDCACASLESLLKKDPEYALAWAVLSELYAAGAMMGFDRLDNQREAAISFAKRAIKIDPLSQHAYQALTRAHFLTRNRAGIIAAGEQCLALNPRAVHFSARIGVYFIYAGEYERGAAILRESLQLNPFFPWMSSLALGLYHYHRKEFEESSEWAEKVDMALVPWVHLLRAASLAQLGQFDRAKKEIVTLLIYKPDITLLGKSYIGSFILDDSLVDEIIFGLEKIGLVIQAGNSMQMS